MEKHKYSEQEDMGQSKRVGAGSDRAPRRSCAASLRQLIRFASGAFLLFSLALWGQTSDSQTGSANKSWTKTTDSQSGNWNPTRTVETHAQSGNRALDTQSVQLRGSNGQFEPYQDIEKATVQVDPATTRTTTRTFARDLSGARTLIQVTEEEKYTLPGGDANVIRTTSNPDVNGRLQPVQREIEETRGNGKDVEETKTTVMLPSVDGLAPAMKVQERRKRVANDVVESQRTTLLPDGSGNWQVSETRQATTRQEGESRSIEEQVSRSDSNGKLGEVSRTITKESENASGEKRSTVEAYSVDVPGSARDGSLHLVERKTTTQRNGLTGQQTTVQQVEQPDPGDPDLGLRVNTLIVETVRPGSSGAQATRTIQMRDANDSMGIVSVDTSKSDNIHVIQIQIAPSDKPK
jgi:hypothetical protein